VDFHCCIESGRWILIRVEMMGDEPLFVLRSNFLMALQPFLDGVDSSLSVNLGLRLRQSTVGVGVTQVIFEDQRDVLVPLNHCRAKIFAALYHEEFLLMLSVFKGIPLVW
jgi:hypothetical protein